MIFSNWRNRRFQPKSNVSSSANIVDPPSIQHTQVQKQIEPDVVLLQDRPLIPLNLFQTWFTLDLQGKMKENVELLKSQNPEFTHYLYDDAMCRNFIRENFDGEILYSFDKLTAGAYKADLWRYCVLYKKGGVYLDIKYSCVDGFKLINLTDKEYFVEDTPIGHIPGIQTVSLRGIYQALLVCMPMNEVLGRCIKEIVKAVKEDCYSNLSPLAITGPSLLARLIDDRPVCLTFKETKDPETVHHIFFQKKELLRTYKEYRTEQAEVKKHYTFYYLKGEAFQYPVLLRHAKIDFSREVAKWGNRYVSSTPSLVVISKKYILMNINYTSETVDPISGITTVSECKPNRYVNSSILLNQSLESVSGEFFDDKQTSELEYDGFTNVRLFCHRKKFFCNATTNIKGSNVTSISQINPLSEVYDLPFQHIEFGSSDAMKTCSNWSYLDSDDKIVFVQQWYPLIIINIFKGTRAKVVDIKYNTPYCFKNVQSSTVGMNWKNEVWFLLSRVHTNIMYSLKSDPFVNKVHFFAVFNKDMTLVRYSEPFKIDGERVEDVGSFLIDDKNFIISHSAMNKTTSISKYALNVVTELLRWNVPSF